MKTIITVILVYGCLVGMVYYSLGKSYEMGHRDGFNYGYHKYIESFIPPPFISDEVPVKRKANLIEKFKG